MTRPDDDAMESARENLRLQRILDKIDEVLARDDARSTASDSRDLAIFMRDIYGVEALEKARELATRANSRNFASLVRVTIEALEREELRGKSA